MSAAASSALVPRFRAFVEAATPYLVRDVPKRLAAVGPALRRLGIWLLPPGHDLLDIARVTYGEDAYTDLIAWALRPATHPATGVQRQRAWLSTLPIPEATDLRVAAQPMPRLYTDDGFPDLVLPYPDFTVVVEAKTASEEHPAPRGQPQSVAYPPAVRRKLALGPAVPVYLVYLTPSGLRPANPQAIATTYLDFAVALAAGLQPADLPDIVRAGLQFMLTHLVIQTDPRGPELRSAVHDLVPAVAEAGPGGLGVKVIANLGGVARLLASLEREGHR